MTDTMTRVTLTNTTTTNTTTVSPSVASTSAMIDLTGASSSASISSTLPLRSTSTLVKEKRVRPKKVHTFEDYLIYILKWPVSLIEELGWNPFTLRFSLTIYSIEPEAGILYKDFLGDDAYPMPLLELYSSFDEYEEITLPWLFEETFEEVNQRILSIKFHSSSPHIRSNEV